MEGAKFMIRYYVKDLGAPGKVFMQELLEKKENENRSS
jgi:hypothetical protein